MGKALHLLRRYFLLLFILGVFLYVVASGVFHVRRYQARFYPNIFIAGEAVGGKTFEEVRDRVRAVSQAFETNGLQLLISTEGATSTILIPQRSSGLTPDVVVEYFSLGDPEETLRRAYNIGRSGTLLTRLEDHIGLLIAPRSLAFPVTPREESIRSLLTRELETVLKKPQDAYFSRASGVIAIVPEVSGEQISVDDVVGQSIGALSMMRTSRLELSVEPKPAAITKKDLEGLLPFAQRIANTLTLELTYEEEAAYVSGSALATWLTLDEKTKAIMVMRDKLTDFIKRYINEEINNPPQNSRFEMRGGELVETVAGKAGSVASIDAVLRQLDLELRARLYAPAALKRELVSIPIEFIEEKPTITKESIHTYGITDLLGTATTSFRGSSLSRKHNISTGAGIISGLLIAPGQEFSLVKAIGDVSEETGFEKEFVIKGDRSVKEAGGGLCQIATTVFRAVLSAGLPVTERQNHTYVVGYYGPGLDATIYGPHPDVKFINDTGSYILLQSHLEGDILVSEFYGKKDGRVAQVTKPVLTDYLDPPPPKYIAAPDKPWGEQECTDQPRRGLTAEATYTVDYGDGRVNEQLFKSVYQPWPKICLVGIKF